MGRATWIGWAAVLMALLFSCDLLVGPLLADDSPDPAVLEEFSFAPGGDFVIGDEEWQQANAQLEACFLKGDYAAARDLAPRVVDLLTRRFGKEDWRVVTTVVHQRSYAKAARLTDGEQERLRHAIIAYRVGQKMSASGDNRNASRYFEAASEATEALLGGDDLVSTQSRASYGGCQTLLGRPDAGREILSRICEVRKKLMGAENPSYATSLTDLAFANSMLEKYEEADDQFLEAEQIFVNTVGERSHQRVACRCNRLSMLVKSGRWDEAEELARSAVEMSAEHQFTDPGMHMRARISLARALHGKRNFDDALREFQAIFQNLANRRAPTAPTFLIEFYEAYVLALDDAGRPAEAAKLRQRIEELRDQAQKSTKPDGCGVGKAP